MRCAPSCLLFVLALCIGLTDAEIAAARSGIRHSTPSIPSIVRSARPHRSAFGHRIGSRHYAVRRFHHHKPHWKGDHKHGHGFFRHRTWAWPYVEAADNQATVIVEHSPPPEPRPFLTGIPSVADLPVSTGIRSGPVGSPTLYVLDGNKRSLRRGAKVLSMGQAESEAESQSTGPRIIHLTVPRGH